MTSATGGTLLAIGALTLAIAIFAGGFTAAKLYVDIGGIRCRV